MCNYFILCAALESIMNNGQSVLKIMASLLLTFHCCHIEQNKISCSHFILMPIMLKVNPHVFYSVSHTLQHSTLKAQDLWPDEESFRLS